MKRFLLLIFVTVIFSTQIKSQEYTFDYYTSTYNNLLNPSIATTTFSSFATFKIPIGFSFPLGSEQFGLVYEDSLGISTNSEVVSYDANINLNAFWVASLKDRSFTGTTSHVAHELVGISGSRIFKVEWRNVGFTNDTSNKDFVNVQIWFNENNQSIEIHIGPNSILNPNSLTIVEPVILMNNHINFYRVSGNPYSPIITPHDPLDSIPSNGMVYRWNLISSGIFENQNSVFNVFPNPTFGTINFEFENVNTDKYKLSVFDYLGKNVIETEVQNQNSFHIDLSNFDSGIYFFRLTNLVNGKLNSGKLLKL